MERVLVEGYDLTHACTRQRRDRSTVLVFNNYCPLIGQYVGYRSRFTSTCIQLALFIAVVHKVIEKPEKPKVDCSQT